MGSKFSKTLLFVSFSFFLSVFLISLAPPAEAALQRCPRHEVKTFLKSKKMKTRYKRASIRDINGYLNTHSVLAYVYNPLDVQAFYDFSLKDIGNNRACVMLDRVLIHYISRPEIVMPSDFPKKSCEFQIILKHEKRHLKVHYDYYERSVPEYKRFLGRVARRVPISVPVSSEEEAAEMQRIIENYYSSKLSEHIGESLMDMDRMQKKIDSPQEYIHTGRKLDRCKQMEEREAKQNKSVFHEHSKNKVEE